jgi:CheY-like chemotaxis protein
VTKVLYVEDNDDNIFMLKMRLELLGDFEVLTAEDCEKGCAMAVSERPDIILMDLEMPVVDGWEASRRLKAIRKPATSPSSRYPRMRWLVSAKRRSRRGATSSTPSRSNLIGWSQPFGAFSPTSNDALRTGIIENRRCQPDRFR